MAQLRLVHPTTGERQTGHFCFAESGHFSFARTYLCRIIKIMPTHSFFQRMLIGITLFHSFVPNTCLSGLNCSKNRRLQENSQLSGVYNLSFSESKNLRGN